MLVWMIRSEIIQLLPTRQKGRNPRTWDSGLFASETYKDAIDL